MLGREILLEYQALYWRNPDFVGWIFAGGTRIGYPIVERQEDREYYLHRDFLKYKDKEFWVQNPVISLDTLYEHQTYAIFAAFYV